MSRTRGHNASPRDRYRKRESRALVDASLVRMRNLRKKSLRLLDDERIPVRCDFAVIARDMWP